MDILYRLSFGFAHFILDEFYSTTNPPKEKKPPMTKEERSRRVMDYQKEYYAAHPDKLAERREKNRIRERERRATKKAAEMAAAQA